MLLLTLILSLLSLLPLTTAWTKEDHEIFRLRDELLTSESPNTTFYTFLNVPPSASQDDINKAYRSLSRKIHPDKAKQAFIASRATSPSSSSKKKKSSKSGIHVSKPPTESEISAHVKLASERYARLGTITEILRGPSRERYDFFLANGFPAWKGTGYYYARYRPGLGTVLFGLFVFGGGLVHYGVLYLSWRRQREFVERYIRHARKSAWGDESGIRGIPGIDTAGSSSITTTPDPTTSSPSQQDETAQQPPLNRRQKRLQEKESRKEASKSSSSSSSRPSKPPPPPPSSASSPSSSSTPPPSTGPRKRVQAENGKTLIVDSIGNVFLEQIEDEDTGKKGEFLLDPEEIAMPTWRDTVLVKAPIWGWEVVKGRVFGSGAGAGAGDGAKNEGEGLREGQEGEQEGEEGEKDGYVLVGGGEEGVGKENLSGSGSGSGSGNARRRGKRGGRAR